MRIRWSPTVLLSALFAVLVALLGVLQWHWLYEIEGQEHYFRQRQVGYATWLFKQAFEREIGSLMEELTPIGSAEDDPGRRLAEGLRRWRAASRWPGLVDAVYRLEPPGGARARLSLLDPGSAVLRPVAWPDALRPLASALDRPDSRAVLPSALAFAVPIPGPGPGGHVIAVLDEEYLVTRTLPELVALFMPPPSFESFDLVIFGTADRRVLFATRELDDPMELGHADIAYGLVPWGEEPGTDPGWTGRLGDPGSAESQVIPSSARRSTPEDERWFGELWDDLYRRGHWLVMARHGELTIPAEVASAKWRRATVGFGLLALLATSLAMLTVATRRTQRAARQQLDQLARVSHELRTPLTVLSSAGDNLADAIVSGEAELREYGRVIQRETRRLHGLVENVLHLSRRRAGVGPAEPRAVPVTALVDDVLTSAGSALSEAGFTVERDLPAEPLAIRGDPRALRSALLNLVSNAVIHAREGRWLRIAATAAADARGDEVRVEVTDRGPGVERRDLPELLRPYARGATASGEGSGLGLAVVADVIAAHGGRISVEESPPGGAVFVLHLPRWRGGEAA